MQLSSEFQNRWNKIASDGSEPKERPIARLRCAPDPQLSCAAAAGATRPRLERKKKKKKNASQRERDRKSRERERERRRQRELLSRSGSWTGSITWTSNRQSMNMGPAIAQVLY